MYEETGNGYHEYIHSDISHKNAVARRRRIHSQISYATNRLMFVYENMWKIGGSVRNVKMRNRFNEPYEAQSSQPIHTFLMFARILEEKHQELVGNTRDRSACKFYL